jgi:MFS family permease
VLPLLSNFGIVLQEAFHETNLSVTRGTIILTLNYSFGMVLSLFSGYVLRKFGYRKVALVASLMTSAGIMLAARASNFWEFLFTFSITCCKYHNNLQNIFLYVITDTNL